MIIESRLPAPPISIACAPKPAKRFKLGHLGGYASFQLWRFFSWVKKIGITMEKTTGQMMTGARMKGGKKKRNGD